MSRVRGHGNRTTERRLRAALAAMRVRGWVIRPNDIKGNPDFFFPASQLVIFVDGCFWHGCEGCGHIPKSHAAFWSEKIRLTKERDRRVTEALEVSGATVLRFWEHELRSALGECVNLIKDALLAIHT